MLLITEMVTKVRLNLKAKIIMGIVTINEDVGNMTLSRTNQNNVKSYPLTCQRMGTFS